MAALRPDTMAGTPTQPFSCTARTSSASTRSMSTRLQTTAFPVRQPSFTLHPLPSFVLEPYLLIDSSAFHISVSFPRSVRLFPVSNSEEVSIFHVLSILISLLFPRPERLLPVQNDREVPIFVVLLLIIGYFRCRFISTTTLLIFSSSTTSTITFSSRYLLFSPSVLGNTFSSVRSTRSVR